MERQADTCCSLLHSQKATSTGRPRYDRPASKIAARPVNTVDAKPRPHRGMQCSMTRKPVCMPQASKVIEKAAKSCPIFLNNKGVDYAGASLQALIKNVRRGGADPSGEQAIKEPTLANVSSLFPYFFWQSHQSSLPYIHLLWGKLSNITVCSNLQHCHVTVKATEITQIRSECL